VGVREIWADALDVAVPGRTAGVCVYGADGGECSAGVFSTGAAGKGRWVLDGVGKKLGIVCVGEFRVVWMCGDSAGDADAVYCVRSALGKLERVAAGFVGDSIFDGLAGGVVVSRVAAEFSGAGVEERVCGVVDGVDVVWAFAYYEFGISELAVRDSGCDCGVVLWVDVEEDGINFCFCPGTCGGGCYVAFFVSDDVGAHAMNRQNKPKESGNRNWAEELKLRFFAHLR
jgi:hypothetical protein